MATNTPAASSAPPLPRALNIKLSLMFFLQYATWGAWLPVLFPILKSNNLSFAEIGNIFAIGAVGAILAPFIAGQIADRYFATERFLGISHLVGAALVWQLANVKEYNDFWWFSLAYSVIYSPTLPLTNSLAFSHLPDRDRDFGRVRVWGTVGWIVAGILIGQWLLHYYTPVDATPGEKELAWAAGRVDAFRLSAILGGILGVFCFFLPHTPPQKGKQPFATWEARNEMQRNPRLIAIFLFAVVISCIHQFYFIHTASFLTGFEARAEGLIKSINQISGVGGSGLMTIGQMSEIFVLALMPLAAKRFSRKTLLAVGIAAYAARMALFAYVEPIAAATHISPVIILMLGIALHGLCFGCFIFFAFMIVDEETTADVRASAQSLFNVVIVGFGTIVGSKLAVEVEAWAKAGAAAAQAATNAVAETAGAVVPTPPDFYPALFAVPMWAAILTLVAFLFLYPGRDVKR